MPTASRNDRPAGASRMSPEFWAIVGIGATVFIGLGAGQMSTRGEIQSLREETRGEIQSLREETRGELKSVREEIQDLRDDHREDFLLLLQEIKDLREAVTANGRVLARIEQALFGSPAKTTPEGEGQPPAERPSAGATPRSAAGPPPRR